MSAAPAPNPAPPNPAVSYRSWLPRLTSRVLLDLRIWMMGFALIGVVFPFAVVPLGVPQTSRSARPSLPRPSSPGCSSAPSIPPSSRWSWASAASTRRATGRGCPPLVETELGRLVFVSDPGSCRIPVDLADELGDNNRDRVEGFQAVGGDFLGSILLAGGTNKADDPQKNSSDSKTSPPHSHCESPLSPHARITPSVNGSKINMLDH